MDTIAVLLYGSCMKTKKSRTQEHNAANSYIFSDWLNAGLKSELQAYRCTHRECTTE